MITRRHAVRAPLAGLGLVLVASFAVLSGCVAAAPEREAGASIEEGSPLGEETLGESAQAFVVECLNAGGTVPGALSVSRTPNGTFCSRSSAIDSNGNPTPFVDTSLPSCWQLAKQLCCIGF